ncbi:MAG: HAD-IA family hydrolase [Pseudomonadota bacterium]
MLDIPKIRAISIDLDDTLWPIWPTIRRAEALLLAWLQHHAPASAALYASVDYRMQLRESLVAAQPQFGVDLSGLRHATLHHTLQRAGEDTALADPAFEVFFNARQQVELYADALPALARLAQRYPVVALSNGNADLARMGLGAYFHAALSAQTFGVGKPDVRFFAAAAEVANTPLDTVLHIGDDAALDVAGAHAAGMQAAWVNRTPDAWSHPGPPPHANTPDLLALCDLLGV